MRLALGLGGAHADDDFSGVAGAAGKLQQAVERLRALEVVDEVAASAP
jgi:hypothetical protein